LRFPVGSFPYLSAAENKLFLFPTTHNQSKTVHKNKQSNEVFQVQLIMTTEDKNPSPTLDENIGAPPTEEEEPMLNNLLVLPPTNFENIEPVVIPPLRPDEPVSSIRAALSELVDFAHLTNYCLIFDGQILDDYGDLSKLSDDSKIQIELRPYQTVREHVMRLQFLLDGNPPVVKSLVETNDDKDSEETFPTKTESSIVTGKKSKKKETKTNPENGKVNSEATLLSPVNLELFFEFAPGEKMDDETLQNILTLEDSMMLSRVVTISFLAPPTPRRKLLGDLSYLHVQILDCPDIFITAIPSGFYINKSTTTLFDPSPKLDAPCLCHALLDCLTKASPHFSSIWNRSLAAAQERVQLTAAESPLQVLYRAAIHPNTSRGLDAAIFRPSWLVPFSGEKWPAPKEHLPVPMEQDYPTFGLDLTTGVSRDWNEELQSAREMPVDTIQERLERAR
jgi:Mitochondrial function, CLU-N-term